MSLQVNGAHPLNDATYASIKKSCDLSLMF